MSIQASEMQGFNLLDLLPLSQDDATVAKKGLLGFPTVKVLCHPGGDGGDEPGG